jgi:hypothetical protein
LAGPRSLGNSPATCAVEARCAADYDCQLRQLEMFETYSEGSRLRDLRLQTILRELKRGESLILLPF